MALIPKIRFISPIVAGISGISWRVFLLVNSIATSFYVTVYVLLGILFHKGLSRLMKKLEWTQHIIFIATIVIVAIFIVVKVRKLVQNKKDEAT
jgi:membrane protein DedA with SNARE-associated domain